MVWKIDRKIYFSLMILLGAGCDAQDLNTARKGLVSAVPERPNYGGRGLPTFKSAPEGAPAIAAISEITFPGETLVASGYGLDGSDLYVWAEGGIRKLNPSLSLPDRFAAVVPDDLPESTMLVWAERNGVQGEPIRVNGAEAWWCMPERLNAGKSGQRLLIMGKNLNVGSLDARVWIEGEEVAREVDVVQATPYQLEVILPALPSGTYRIAAHNGSGGRFGWSEAVEIQIVAEARGEKELQVNVTEFGAIPNDGKDDAAAIQAAIDHVGEFGGGTVLFPKGEFLIGSPVGIDADFIELKGAGKGSYEAGSEEGKNGTLLTYGGARSIPPMLFDIKGRGCTFLDMMLVNGHDGNNQHVIAVHATDAVMKNLRFVMLDRRDWGYEEPGPWAEPGEVRGAVPGKFGIIDDAALIIDTEGDARATFTDSEVHTSGPGMQIGRFGGWGAFASRPASESVLIERVVFRGYYAGEPNGKMNAGASGRANGLIFYSARKVAVQHCSFGGADRAHRKIMGRTVLVFNTSARALYFAHNKSVNVGPHPSAEGMDKNQGEQYLIHYRYPYGGLFNVTGSDHSQTSVTTSNIKPFGKNSWRSNPLGTKWDLSKAHFHYDTRGGKVPEDVGTNENWILFICAGKGVGQWRVVKGVQALEDGYRFECGRPWRVPPNETSRVNLMPAYRKVVIYDNLVDTGELIEETKTHGVCFWFESFGNIVDGNTFKNLTSGIVFNSRFRGPTAWNTIRNNTIENIHGYPGDTSETAAGLVDHFRVTVQWPEPVNRVWYEVGNVYRGNTIRDADAGAYLHAHFTGFVRHTKPTPVSHPDGGIVLGVVENNRFEKVDEGIILSAPINSSVIRHNLIDASDSKYALFNQNNLGDVVNSVFEENSINGQDASGLNVHLGLSTKGVKIMNSVVKTGLTAVATGVVVFSAGAEDLCLQHGNLVVPGKLVNRSYQASATTLRLTDPDIVQTSKSMYIGTHVTGGLDQINRSLFSFDLSPLKVAFDGNPRVIEQVAFVLTVATANPDFQEGSTFRAYQTLPFDEAVATWNLPGAGHVPGGKAGDLLCSVVVQAAEAGRVGSEIVFSGEAWKQAVEDALDSGSQTLSILVRRGAEENAELKNYFFRPANNMHVHSKGTVDWRPKLMIRLAD